MRSDDRKRDDIPGDKQEDRHQEDRRQEDEQAGRRQSGDRRTDRQATDRQATSVLATGGQSVGYRFHSRVSLSSYRMKFVWPESLQGLGQQAGKLNLKNRIVLLQAGLEIYEILKRRDSSVRWFPGSNHPP